MLSCNRVREKGKKKKNMNVVSLEHCSPLLEVVLQVRIPRVWSRLQCPAEVTEGPCPSPKCLGQLTILAMSPRVWALLWHHCYNRFLSLLLG